MNLRKPDPEKLRAFRTALKAFYDAVTAEEIPENINAVVRKLK